MPPNFKILAFLSSLLFFAVFLGLIRRKSINPFYAFLWFTIAIIFLSAVIFEKSYKALANFFHLTDASFIFVAGMIYFLMIYVLHLSLRISELSDRIQELISHSAILERDLRHTRASLEEEIARKSREDPAVK